MGVDLIFIDQLAGLATTDIGLGFVVGNDQPPVWAPLEDALPA